jgi:hypothetical protein
LQAGGLRQPLAPLAPSISIQAAPAIQESSITPLKKESEALSEQHTTSSLPDPVREIAITQDEPEVLGNDEVEEEEDEYEVILVDAVTSVCPIDEAEGNDEVD